MSFWTFLHHPHHMKGKKVYITFSFYIFCEVTHSKLSTLFIFSGLQLKYFMWSDIILYHHCLKPSVNKKSFSTYYLYTLLLYSYVTFTYKWYIYYWYDIYNFILYFLHAYVFSSKSLNCRNINKKETPSFVHGIINICKHTKVVLHVYMFSINFVTTPLSTTTTFIMMSTNVVYFMHPLCNHIKASKLNKLSSCFFFQQDVNAKSFYVCYELLYK